MIDQQADVELDPGQLGDRQTLQTFAQRRASDLQGIDAIGLAAIAAAAALAGHQPRCDANDAFAADQQKPLKRARDVAAVLKRPDPFAAQAARPIQRLRKAPSSDVNGLLTRQLARRCHDRGDRVRALVHVRTEHDHDPRPFHLD